jgi:hypothetical protein
VLIADFFGLPQHLFVVGEQRVEEVLVGAQRISGQLAENLLMLLELLRQILQGILVDLGLDL